MCVAKLNFASRFANFRICYRIKAALVDKIPHPMYSWSSNQTYIQLTQLIRAVAWQRSSTANDWYTWPWHKGGHYGSSPWPFIVCVFGWYKKCRYRGLHACVCLVYRDDMHIKWGLWNRHCGGQGLLCVCVCVCVWVCVCVCACE